MSYEREDGPRGNIYNGVTLRTYSTSDSSLDHDQLLAAKSAIKFSGSHRPTTAVPKIRLFPRPAESFPAATFNPRLKGEAQSRIDYHQWPPASTREEVERGDFRSRGNGEWEIGGILLRSYISGLYPRTGNEETDIMSLQLLTIWLHRLESEALDIAYDLASWIEQCQIVWETILQAVSNKNVPSVGFALAANKLYTCKLLGRSCVLECSNATILSNSGLPSAIDTIQDLSLYSVTVERDIHPVHGRRVYLRPGEPMACERLTRDANALCTVVDLNNKLRSRPVPFVPAPRQAVIQNYMENPILDHQQIVPPRTTTFISIEGEPVWTSNKDLGQCQDILIDELLVPKRHVGRSLLCRVLTRCRVHSGISFMVEDTRSNVIPVTLMSPTPFPAVVYSPTHIQTLWPIGTCLYIKEPYVRMGSRGRAEILIAWPKDMVEVPRVRGIFDHPEVSPASTDLASYRLAAASAFTQNKFRLAIRLASIGLNLMALARFREDHDENEWHHCHLLLGRALVYWVDDQPGAAYSDCLQLERKLVGHPPQKVMPLWRKMNLIRLQAAYKLRLFTMANRHLTVCEIRGVHSSVLSPYREALKIRKEEMNGNLENLNNDPELSPSVGASYVGPIQVVFDPVKGRKIVTTRAVRSGEILLSEPPVVSLKFDGSPGVMCSTIKWGQQTFKASPHHVSWIMHQIMDDPSIGQFVHALAPNANLESQNLGLTDDERMEVFRNPCEIEVDLLEQQINRNSFGENNMYSLYGLVSMISHSCKPNIFKGGEETQCFRAMNDMAEGEELLVSYVPSTRSFESRHGSLTRNWQFECDCALCEADRTPGDRHSHRAGLMVEEWPALQSEANAHIKGSSNKGKASVPKKKLTIDRLAAFASKVDATYASGRSMKLELSQVVFVLADVWASIDLKEAIKFYRTGYRHLEWELYTVEKMKRTKKFVRKYGYTVTDEPLQHLTRLKTIAKLYEGLDMPDIGKIIVESASSFAQMIVHPSKAHEFVIGNKGKKEPNININEVNPDDILIEIEKLKPGEKPDGPLTQQELDKMFKKVKMPNGEMGQVLDFTGTMLEGQEKAMMEFMMEVDKKRGRTWKMTEIPKSK